MVRGVLLRPLPYRDPGQLVFLQQPATRAGVVNAQFSVPELMDYRAQSRALSGIVEYHSMPFILLGRGEPRRVQTGVVSANFFDLLGVRPALGRTFRPGEDVVGAEPVLVLSYGFWKTQLGGDPAIIGRTFTMLLRDLPPHDPLRADVEQIRRAAERGTLLTGQLLTFGQGQVPEIRVFRVNQVVGAMPIAHSWSRS